MLMPVCSVEGCSWPLRSHLFRRARARRKFDWIRRRRRRTRRRARTFSLSRLVKGLEKRSVLASGWTRSGFSPKTRCVFLLISPTFAPSSLFRPQHLPSSTPLSPLPSLPISTFSHLCLFRPCLSPSSFPSHITAHLISIKPILTFSPSDTALRRTRPRPNRLANNTRLHPSERRAQVRRQGGTGTRAGSAFSGGRRCGGGG